MKLIRMMMMKIETLITVDNYSLFSRDMDGMGGEKWQWQWLWLTDSLTRIMIIVKAHYLAETLMGWEVENSARLLYVSFILSSSSHRRLIQMMMRVTMVNRWLVMMNIQWMTILKNKIHLMAAILVEIGASGFPQIWTSSKLSSIVRDNPSLKIWWWLSLCCWWWYAWLWLPAI